MTTRVQESIMVNVPVSVAYNQWTQFEEFPQFMGGVTSVTQLSDDRLQWVAQIAGVRRQWEAKILEQVPDRKVAWAATESTVCSGRTSVPISPNSVSMSCGLTAMTTRAAPAAASWFESVACTP